MIRDLTKKDKIELTLKEKFIISFYETVMSFVGAVIIIWLMFTFGVKGVAVDGESMLPTLNHGDRLVDRKSTRLNSSH